VVVNIVEEGCSEPPPGPSLPPIALAETSTPVVALGTPGNGAGIIGASLAPIFRMRVYRLAQISAEEQAWLK